MALVHEIMPHHRQGSQPAERRRGGLEQQKIEQDDVHVSDGRQINPTSAPKPRTSMGGMRSPKDSPNPPATSTAARSRLPGLQRGRNNWKAAANIMPTAAASVPPIA